MDKIYVNKIMISEGGQLYINKGRGLRKQCCKYHLGAPCDEYCPDFSLFANCFGIHGLENLADTIKVILCNREYWTEKENFIDMRKKEDNVT